MTCSKKNAKIWVKRATMQKRLQAMKDRHKIVVTKLRLQHKEAMQLQREQQAERTRLKKERKTERFWRKKAGNGSPVWDDARSRYDWA